MMKTFNKKFVAVLLTLPLFLGSCEDILGKWERPAPTPIPIIFTLSDLAGDAAIEASELTVTDKAGNPIAVTPRNGKYYLYKSYISDTTDLWFEAITATGKYINRTTPDDLAVVDKTGKLPMATIGDVILSDGTFAQKGTNGEQAVIVYIGSVPFYFRHFLAIAIEDAGKEQWIPALSKVNEYAEAHPITIGDSVYDSNTTGTTYYDQVDWNENVTSATSTELKQGWRLPSITDWRYLIAGLCQLDSPTPTSPLGIKDLMLYGNGTTLMNRINTICGNSEMEMVTNCLYWSSSDIPDGNNRAWAYTFDNSKIVYLGKNGSGFNARAVFAY